MLLLYMAETVMIELLENKVDNNQKQDRNQKVDLSYVPNNVQLPENVEENADEYLETALTKIEENTNDVTNEKIAEIEKDLEMTYGFTDITYTQWWVRSVIDQDGGGINFTPLSAQEALEQLTMIQKELLLYPVEFVKNSWMKRIVLVKWDQHLLYPSTTWANTTSWLYTHSNYIIVGSYVWGFDRSIFHHEFFHLLDTKKDDMYTDDNKWMKLLWGLVNSPTEYGKTNANENQAEFWSSLMISGKWMLAEAKKNMWRRSRIELITWCKINKEYTGFEKQYSDEEIQAKYGYAGFSGQEYYTKRSNGTLDLTWRNTIIQKSSSDSPKQYALASAINEPNERYIEMRNHIDVIKNKINAIGNVKIESSNPVVSEIEAEIALLIPEHSDQTMREKILASLKIDNIFDKGSFVYTLSLAKKVSINYDNQDMTLLEYLILKQTDEDIKAIMESVRDKKEINFTMKKS